MPLDREQAGELLVRATGIPDVSFHNGQWEAIDALVNKRRKLLVVERTGWGKSSVYFISTRYLRDQGAGPTIIVSPLLSLIRNQIDAAGRVWLKAATISSANTNEWERIQQEIAGGEIDLLLISPERLANDEFVTDVLLPIANSIGLLVVDEAHCISDWGHDFRPDYRRLVNVLQQMPPNMPVLGTTATANNRVVNDVIEQLGDVDLIRGPLVRETLELQVVQTDSRAERLAWLATYIPQLPGTGIVYALTVRDTEHVSEWLVQNGINAAAYHASVYSPDFEDSTAYKLHLEEQLLANQIKVLVATTALGMGYDKPDLGFVVHYQAPGSIVAYYQQVGRAGRAIDRANGIMLSGSEDEQIHEFFRCSSFPDERDIGRILDALDETDGQTVRELETRLNLRQSKIAAALKYMSVENPAPVIKDGSRWSRTPVQYEMDHERIAHLTHQREIEWAEVCDYLSTTDCQMVYLCNALDDPHPQPCGRCQNCLGEPPVAVDVEDALINEASLFLRHSEVPIKPKAQVAAGAFDEYGFRGNLPANLRANEGRVLSWWREPGWGRMVSEDKHANRFRDELVAAVAEMIEQRWRPTPPPAWVTCVPSLRHTDLVPDFAQRLADALDLQFHAVIRKVRDNEPQKDQQNRYHQCRNLDGAFAIDGELTQGPVLLVDDIVDSGWTMTVLSALLRQAGSDEVFPVALASTGPGN